MTVVVESLVRGTISHLLAPFNLRLRDQEMLDYCQSLGEVYTGYIDQEFVCCWGLIPPSFLATQAYLWMWAPEPMKHQFIFVRQSQLQVQRMLEKYDEIIGDCHIDAKSSRRWLKWLGAEFGEQHGALVPFSIRKSHG